MMTEEQKKVMRTQDIKYVEMKRVAEAKVRFIATVTNPTQIICTLLCLDAARTAEAATIYVK